jgi:hypothetical protein
MRGRAWLGSALLGRGLGAMLCAGLVVPAPVVASTVAVSSSPSSSSSLCPPATPAAHPKPAGSIRFGVDPGLAGNPFPSLKGPVPINEAAEARALHALSRRTAR